MAHTRIITTMDIIIARKWVRPPRRDERCSAET
jgi:hypothetical protein